MKGPLASRILSSLAFLAWAAALIHFYASGRIAKYLAPDFRIAVLAGGIGLAVIGLFVLLTCRQETACNHDHGHDHDHEHSHDEEPDIHPVIAFLIMVAPLALCCAWSQDRFSGEASLERKGAYATPASSGASFLGADLPPLTREIIARQHPANREGFHAFALTELFFTSTDDAARPLIEGMSVETQGRLVEDRGGPPGQRRLYRLFITCCAADSQAIPIVVRFPNGVPSIPENAWVTLAGTMHYPEEGGGPLPVLAAASVKETPPPAEESFMRGGSPQ